MPLDVLLQNISVVSGIFPVVVMLINYRRLDKILKLASLYFIISFLVDSYLWLSFHEFREKNTMPVFHSYVIISILLLGLVYYKMYINTTLKIVAIVLCSITMLIALFYAQSILSYPSVSITSLSVLLIILSLIYFYQLLNPHEFVHLEKQGLFWINTGILFYSAVNIFLFMVLNRIPKAEQHNYYMIHSVTNIIANILYSIGLLCKPQKTS
jgi:hypothetical protein